jgi:hypothetical protein
LGGPKAARAAGPSGCKLPARPGQPSAPGQCLANLRRCRYLVGVATDLWLGAATTLIGAALGGSISFIVSRQQIKSAWMQREADAAHERNRRSEDRRFAAYSEFITRARSCRNAVGAYYLHSDNRPSIKELDALLQAARDASTLVFLVVESEEAYEGCRAVVRSLGVVQAVLHGLRSSGTDNPWNELNPIIGRSTRRFQNAVRTELGVSGPTKPWDGVEYDRWHKEAQQAGEVAEF